MIVEEVIINNRTFIKRTPREGYVLHKVGTDEYYAEAIDLPTSNFEYEEVEEPKIDVENNEGDLDDKQRTNISE